MKKYDESFKTEQIKNDSSMLMGNPFAAIIKSHKLIQHSVMILTHIDTHNTISRIHFVKISILDEGNFEKINYFVKDD